MQFNYFNSAKAACKSPKNFGWSTNQTYLNWPFVFPQSKALSVYSKTKTPSTHNEPARRTHISIGSTRYMHICSQPTYNDESVKLAQTSQPFSGLGNRAHPLSRHCFQPNPIV